MKLNRCLVVNTLVIALALATSILLSSCASMGDGKDAGTEKETPQRTGEQRTAVKETGVSSPGVRKQPVAYRGGSAEEPRLQAASGKASQGRFKQYAAQARQGLNRILTKALPGVDWNRIGTILAGIVAMLLIYGLAFGLGRLSFRRRGAVRREADRPGEVVRGSVPR